MIRRALCALAGNLILAGLAFLCVGLDPLAYLWPR